MLFEVEVLRIASLCQITQFTSQHKILTRYSFVIRLKIKEDRSQWARIRLDLHWMGISDADRMGKIRFTVF